MNGERCYRLVMLWPLDPNERRTVALQEAATRVTKITDTHNLTVIAERYEVIPPETTIGRDGWLLSYEAFAVAIEQAGTSPLEPYLPLDVVIRDGIGPLCPGRGHHAPLERQIAGERIAQLYATGVTTADIAAQVGVSKRTLQRITAQHREMPAVSA